MITQLCLGTEISLNKWILVATYHLCMPLMLTDGTKPTKNKLDCVGFYVEMLISINNLNQWGWSRSYQTFTFAVFRFSLLSLSVCNKGKNMYSWEMVKLISKKLKNSLFTKEKSLVGLTPGVQEIYIHKWNGETRLVSGLKTIKKIIVDVYCLTSSMSYLKRDAKRTS